MRSRSVKRPGDPLKLLHFIGAVVATSTLSVAHTQGLPPLAQPGSFQPWSLGGIVAGDFDGDGRTDAVIQTTPLAELPGSIYGFLHFRNDGFGNFALVNSQNVGKPVGTMISTDLDQDGMPEVSLFVQGISRRRTISSRITKPTAVVQSFSDSPRQQGCSPVDWPLVTSTRMVERMSLVRGRGSGHSGSRQR